jgi:formate dehydrogenase beta subunit
MSDARSPSASASIGRGKRAGVRGTPKGRQVDPRAREEVGALLGDAPRRSDLLIEYLHRIQDHYGHLSAAHLAALAAELKMAMAEVYEVATFYHHFDVVKEGETAPPTITVRVCDSIACELAGGRELFESVTALLGPGVRVLPTSCVGRCETAPVAVIGQNPVPYATPEKITRLVEAGAVVHPRRTEPGAHPHLDVVTPGHIDYAAYRAAGGIAQRADMRSRRTVSRASAARPTSSPRWSIRACEGWAGLDFQPGASGRSSRPSRRRA